MILKEQQLGKTLWNIADQMRSEINADDFRDYMLSFLFFIYLSFNYEESTKKDFRKDFTKIAQKGVNPRFVPQNYYLKIL